MIIQIWNLYVLDSSVNSVGMAARVSLSISFWQKDWQPLTFQRRNFPKRSQDFRGRHVRLMSGLKLFAYIVNWQGFGRPAMSLL